MSIESLGKRVDYLKVQVIDATNNVKVLGNQLEQSTIQMHIVTGHLNEAMYLLSQEQKEREHVEVDNEIPG